MDLEDLLHKPLSQGDVLANANTIILMGRLRDGDRMARALHVAKHRNSRCDDAIRPYQIGEHGIEMS
jgi:hypothetical protein